MISQTGTSFFRTGATLGSRVRILLWYPFGIVAGGSLEMACEARAWVANESVDKDHDPMTLDFRSGQGLERAITLAKGAIESSGYTTVRLIDQYPCRRDETSEDCQFYDDAEEKGLCVVFIREQYDGCDTPDH